MYHVCNMQKYIRHFLLKQIFLKTTQIKGVSNGGHMLAEGSQIRLNYSSRFENQDIKRTQETDGLTDKKETLESVAYTLYVTRV